MITFKQFFKQTSPVTFEYPWHLALIGHHLEKFERREIRNLMVFTPPQHAKSTTVAERLPAYHFARDPLSHVLLCSYSDDLAVRAAVNCRSIVQSDWWQEKFGYPVGKATEARWMFQVPGQDGRYSLVASGIAGSITGHSAKIVVVDDVLRSRQDALSPTIRENIIQNYTGSVETRLPKDGGVVIITTRWHAGDLAGFLLQRAKENKKAAQWTVLVLPAINDGGHEAYILDTATGEQKFLNPYEALWPSRFPREVLDQRHADLGEGLWQALYMCRPSMGANVLFPADKWRVLDHVAPVRIAQAWDCGTKTGAGNDYSVCCSLGQTSTGEYVVLDVYRAKLDFPRLKEAVFIKWTEMYRRYGITPEVVIEDAGAGQQLIQEIEAVNASTPFGTMIQPIPAKPIKNKFVRAEAIASYQNNGLVALPSEAPWRQEFIRELEEFPLAQHDDQVDAYVYAQALFVRGAGVFKPGPATSTVVTLNAEDFIRSAPPLPSIDSTLDGVDAGGYEPEFMSAATAMAIQRMRDRGDF